MFLAQFECTNNQTYDSDGEEVDDDDGVDDEAKEWALNKVFTPEGLLVAQHIDIQKDDFIDENDLSGTEGSCLVMVRRIELTSFLRKATTIKTQEWTQALIRRMETGDVEPARSELLQISDLATRGSTPVPDLENLASLITVRYHTRV